MFDDNNVKQVSNLFRLQLITVYVSCIQK